MRNGGAKAEGISSADAIVCQWADFLRNLALGLTGCDSLKDCLIDLLHRIMDVPGIDAGVVWIDDEGTGTWRAIDQVGLPGDSDPQLRLIAGFKMAFTTPLAVESVEAFSTGGMAHAAILKWQRDGSPIAALTLASRDIRLSEGPSIQFLDIAFAQVQAALDRVRSHGFLESRIAESTREFDAAKVLLEENGYKLNLALKASKAGFSIWNTESGTVELDIRSRELYGLALDEPVNMEKFFDRIHPADRDWMRAEIASIHTPEGSDTFEHEFRIVHPDLGERWIARKGRVERDGHGNVTRSIGITIDITKLKRNELALRVSEERYRRLHESMMDAFAAVDMEGRVVDCNPAFESLLGYSRDELLSMNFNDFTPADWHDYEKKIIDTQVLERGFSDIYEKQYRRKDGTLFHVELRVSLLRDEHGAPEFLWGIVRDITAHKQAERAMLDWNATLERRVSERTAELRQSEARFRQLTEVTREGIAITEGGILVDGNPQLARMHGYELHEMIGKPVSDFIAPQSRTLVTERMRDGEEASYEAFEKHKDGSMFPVEVHARMIEWEGQRIRVTALSDISEKKRVAMRLHAQQAELEHGRCLALVGEVSAGIVHQVAQPLSAMTLNIVSVLERLGHCKQKSCGGLGIVRELEEDVCRLREAVVHLRSLSNPSRQNFELLDLNHVIAEVVRPLAQEAVNRGISVELDLDDGLPMLTGDRVQLRQVVLNLLRNGFDACRDSPEGHRLVVLTTRVRATREVGLEVRDTGAGIPVEILDQLFAPFFTTKPEGLGMGLRLAQTIIRAHGGSIEGINLPDRTGACFRVILPVRSEECYPKV